MSIESYFVRTRGRVSGPFDRTMLIKMVRRGTLATIDEVSKDREVWQSVSTLSWLVCVETPFSSRSRESSQTTTAPAGPVAEVPDASHREPTSADLVSGVSDSSPTDPITEGRYYLSREGEVIGPFAPTELVSMVTSGVLQPDDMIWHEGDNAFQPASQISELSGSWRRNPMADPTPGVASYPPQPAETEKKGGGEASLVGARVHRLSVATGVSAAVLLLFCLNVPWGKEGSRLLWWWDWVSQDGQLGAVLFSFYILFIGLGLLLIAPMLRGRLRGWIYLAMGGLGVPLLQVAGLVTGVPAPKLFLSSLVPPVCVALIVTASAYRSMEPEANHGRIVQSAGGGLTIVTAMIVVVFSVSGFLEAKLDTGHIPGWFVLSFIVLLAGQLCGLICGAFGIMSALAVSANRLNLAAIVLGSIALSVPAIVGPIIGAGSATDPSVGARFALVQAIRLVGMGYALTALCGIGVSELLVEAGRPRPRI